MQEMEIRARIHRLRGDEHRNGSGEGVVVNINAFVLLKDLTTLLFCTSRELRAEIGDGRQRKHSNEVSPWRCGMVTEGRGTTSCVRNINLTIFEFLLWSYATTTGLYRGQELPDLLEFSTSNPHTRASSGEVFLSALPSATRSTSTLTVEPGSRRILMRPCATKSCNSILDVTMKPGSMTPESRSQRMLLRCQRFEVTFRDC